MGVEAEETNPDQPGFASALYASLTTVGTQKGPGGGRALPPTPARASDRRLQSCGGELSIPPTPQLTCCGREEVGEGSLRCF